MDPSTLHLQSSGRPIVRPHNDGSTMPLNGKKQVPDTDRPGRRLFRATLALALITLLATVGICQVIRHNSPLYPRFAPRQKCVVREASMTWRTRYWVGLEYCVALRGGFVHDDTISHELHVGYGRDECVSSEDAARLLAKWYLSLESVDCTWLYQGGDFYLSPFYGMMYYVRLQRIIKASIALTSFCGFCTLVCAAWCFWRWRGCRRRQPEDESETPDDSVLFV